MFRTEVIPVAQRSRSHQQLARVSHQRL